MRISLLNKREPFNNILVKTLKRYLEGEEMYDKIFWTNKYSLDYFKFFRSAWFENKYLNFYASFGIEKHNFEVLVKEYGKSLKFWLNLLQRIYVLFAVTKPGRLICSTSVLVIHESPQSLKETIILGGNHRIRLLHPKKKESTVILKEGFRKLWIQNEIYFREKLNLTCAPVLLNISEDKLSFTEEYTPGTPINRLPQNRMSFYAKKAATQLFNELAKPNLEEVSFQEWFTLKINEIKKDFNSGFDREVNSELEAKLSEVLAGFDALLHNKSGSINISVSHGDFQNANILLKEDEELVFIDWESMDERWFLYDLLTLFLESRESKIIEYDKFKSRFNTNQILTEYLKKSLFNEKIMYLIYTLEELHYQVLNTCEPIFYESGKGLLSYLMKVESELVKIENQ